MNNNQYVLPHLIRKPSLRKSLGLPVENKRTTMPFPNIFTSFNFVAKDVKEALGVDSFLLNKMIAVFSRMNVHVLIGLKNKVLAKKTFADYMKADEHPYSVVVKALVISLMLGRSKRKKEIEAFIKKLNTAMRPHITNVTRVHNPYEVTREMANLTYNELRACRSKTTKPSSTLGSDPSQAETVSDIADYFRDLIKEVRLVQGILSI